MPEIYFSRKLASAGDIIGEDSARVAAFRKANNLRPHDRVLPGNAYTLHYASPQSQSVVRQINALPRHERLSLIHGVEAMGDGLHQFAAFFDRNLSREQVNQVNGLVGAGTTAMHVRLTGFQKAMLAYQEAVLAFNKLVKSGGPGIGQRRQQAEARVRAAYDTLKTSYRTELDRFAPEAYRHKNRGNALSNAERAITLARRSPRSTTVTTGTTGTSAPSATSDPRLNVADTAQVRRVGSFAKHLNHIGKAAIVVDAGLRINDVHATHQAGGDWLREGAVQMTGFGSAGAVGGLAGKYMVIGGTALAVKTGLLVAGPAGWAVLSVIVGAGVVAGFTAGHYADKGGQGFASWLWD